MSTYEVYIIISILALVIIAALYFLSKRASQRRLPSPLTALAFVFVIAGIFFGEERWLGYSLIGVGIVLAILDGIKSRIRSSH